MLAGALLLVVGEAGTLLAVPTRYHHLGGPEISGKVSEYAYAPLDEIVYHTPFWRVGDHPFFYQRDVSGELAVSHRESILWPRLVCYQLLVLFFVAGVLTWVVRRERWRQAGKISTPSA